MRATILLQTTILFILLERINARLLMNSKGYDTANANNNHNRESTRSYTRENAASLKREEGNNQQDNTVEIVLLIVLPVVGLVFGIFIFILWFRKYCLSKMILLQNTQNQLLQLKSASSNSISESFREQNQSHEYCYPPNQQAPLSCGAQPQQSQMPAENFLSLDLQKRNSFPSISPQLLNPHGPASAPAQESLSSDQLNNKNNHNQLLKDEFGKNLLMQKLIIQMLIDKQAGNKQEIKKDSRHNSIVEGQKVASQDDKQLEINIIQSDTKKIIIPNQNIQVNESTPTPIQPENNENKEVLNDPVNQLPVFKSNEINSNNNASVPPNNQQQFLEDKEGADRSKETFNQLQLVETRARYQQLLNKIVKPDLNNNNNNPVRGLSTDNGTSEIQRPVSILCTECKQNQLSSIFSCGHMACSGCSDKQTSTCPFCSLPILSKKPIFFC